LNKWFRLILSLESFNENQNTFNIFHNAGRRQFLSCKQTENKKDVKTTQLLGKDNPVKTVDGNKF
jgi:hypothetical protein